MTPRWSLILLLSLLVENVLKYTQVIETPVVGIWLIHYSVKFIVYLDRYKNLSKQHVKAVCPNA